MIKEEKTLKNSELKTDTSNALSKMYKDLSNAINSNNIQSIWQLSKNITKYHFRFEI
ncbi:MAG: hypothetical protein KGD68_11450 [Candidatus Lokiarchaeota archaeon]|nr:hypothetical protein [Candidatus Lokiarchaeota archaeon]